jgi:hypothetical protein
MAAVVSLTRGLSDAPLTFDAVRGNRDAPVF